MAIPPNRQPSPNPKYPFVGPNYIKYGETQGYIYNPYTDKFSPDPQAIKELGQANGTIPPDPKKPGVSDIIVPIGVGAIALEGGRQIGKKIPGLLSSGDKVPGTSAPNTSGVTNPTPITAPGPTGSVSPATKPAGLMSANQPSGTAPATPDVISAARVSPVGSAPLPDGSQGTLMSDGSVVGVDGGVLNPDGSFVPPESSGLANGIQAGVGAVQAYQAYNEYKKGNTVGAGIYGAAGISNLGSAAANAGIIGGGETLGAIAAPASGVAGAYGLYQTADYVGNAPAGGRRNVMSTAQGAASGAALGGAIGSAVPVVGTAIGAGVGAIAGGLYGFAMSHFGSSKDKYQMMRDEVRDYWKENGILDEEWQGTLADGSKFDFGKDGKGFQKFDYDDPMIGNVIALGNIVSAGEGLSGKPGEAVTQLYTSAALSNAGGDYNKARDNMLHFAQQRGLTPENVQQQLDQMLTDELIDQREHDVYSAGIPMLFSGAAPAVSTAPPAAPAAPVSPVVNAGNTAGAKPLAPAPINQPAAAPAAPAQPVRSQTSSPGIGKDGKRISYGMIGIGR